MISIFLFMSMYLLIGADWGARAAMLPQSGAPAERAPTSAIYTPMMALWTAMPGTVSARS